MSLVRHSLLPGRLLSVGYSSAPQFWQRTRNSNLQRAPRAFLTCSLASTLLLIAAPAARCVSSKQMKSERKQLNRDLLDSIIMRNIAHVRELLEQGADVNARDQEHNETSLMLAVKFANADMVRLLIDAGAEVDARDDSGRTALFYATVTSEVFEALLGAGADIHAQDEEGNTILMRKVSESASLSDVEKLLQLGVDQGVRTEAGETALDMAESLGLVKVVERLRIRAD